MGENFGLYTKLLMAPHKYALQVSVKYTYVNCNCDSVAALSPIPCPVSLGLKTQQNKQSYI